MARPDQAGTCGEIPVPRIVAHRGASANAPENTLAAVRLAWEESADAVEIDVRLSRDGELVVIHDDDTLRVAGKPGRVAAQTLAELRALDVGKWKGPQWTGERIPTLDEVLSAVPEGKRLLVEVKGGTESIEKVRAAIGRAGKKPEQILIIGFSLAAMQAARQALPEHPVSWLVQMRREHPTGPWQPSIDELIETAAAAGFAGLSLNATEAIEAGLVGKMRAARLELNVWTVDLPEVARRLKGLGIDYLSTNRPGWIRAQLAAR